jgi:hypothetical protein
MIDQFGGSKMEALFLSLLMVVLFIFILFYQSYYHVSRDLFTLGTE